MTFRTLAASSLAVLCLVVAGCGDDEESVTATTAENSTAQTAALKDVEPRATKPNIVGGSGPIDELLTTAGNDAVGYWEQVFENSNLPYKKPTINVLTTAGDNGCGAQFDPTQKPFFLCLGDNGSIISLGGPAMDKVRDSAGDAAVVFLSGFWVAADTNDQLTGNPLSKTGKIDQQFAETAACFTGAWIRNLADRQILEAGDDQEVLKSAESAIGQGVGAAAVTKGFNSGVGSCQGGESSSGGGSDDSGGGEQPPASPSE